MTLRAPAKAKTPFVPNAVVVKSTGELINLDDPILRALAVAIGEDFMDPIGLSETTDIVSAACSAVLTLRVLDAAGLRAVER